MSTKIELISTLAKHKKTVYQIIRVFLNRTESKNTSDSYERNIRMFFTKMKNKTIEDLTYDDIFEVDLPTLEEYKHILKTSGNYKNSSINQNIESLRSLFNFFKGSGINVNTAMFKSLVKLSDDRINVGYLSPDEVLLLSELALFETHKGSEKQAIILLALETSIRKKAITGIKYSHIKPHPTKKDYYRIESDELFDKGSMVKDRDIRKSLYNLLLSLKNNRIDDGSDFIFTLKSDQLNDIIKRLAQKAGLDKNRSISFHSIKRAGVDLAHSIGGLHAAQMQGGHKSVDTTVRYIHKSSNIVSEILSDSVDESIFEELSRDEMLILLKSFGNGTGLQLRSKAKEIIDERV